MSFEIIPRAEADVVSLMKSIDKVVINPLIFLLFALAMVYFLYGVAQYLLSPDNEEVRKTSKSHMLWGLIGLFVMVGVFGILSFITSSLGVQNIKIQSNGDYTVSSTINGTTTSTDIKQSGLDIPQTEAPKGDANTSGVNLSKTQVNQNPGLDPTKSPFPDYIDSGACWHKVIHSAGLTEYKATHATTPEGDELSMADYARYVYIKETGNKTTVNQNLPTIFDYEVLYGKNINFYYSWMDLRAPTKVPSSPGDCDLKLNPTQSSSNYTYLDKYKSSNVNISTAVQDKAIDPTLSPFPDFDPNAMCWSQEFYLNGDTEYGATQNVKYNNTSYPTLSSYLRARFLNETAQQDSKVSKNLPIMYDYQPLYNSANKKYYVWIDVRAPIKAGTTADCNFKISLQQSTDNYKLTGKYQSSDTNISAGQVAKTLDFTKSPFPAYFLNPSACWRKEMVFKDKTEYKALEFVDASARTTYLSETHQLESKANQSYPIKYGVQTAFNGADQLYYVWVDERAPIGTGSVQSCNLTAVSDLLLLNTSIRSQTVSFKKDLQSLQNSFQIQSAVNTIAAAILLKADISSLQKSFQQSQSQSTTTASVALKSSIQEQSDALNANIAALQNSFKQSESGANIAASAALKSSIQTQSDALNANVQALQKSFQQTQSQENITAENALNANIKKQADTLVVQLKADTTASAAVNANIQALQKLFQQSQSESNTTASAALKSNIQTQANELNTNIKALQKSFQAQSKIDTTTAKDALSASIQAQADALISQLQTSASTGLIPTAESAKTSSLTGSVTSDASHYRVVDSGVSPSLSQARSIAIHNALIQIAGLKGVTDLAGIIYKVVPPEKYYPLDTTTGNYDYFVVVESPK